MSLRKARLNAVVPQERQHVDLDTARQIAEGLVLADDSIGCRKCGACIAKTTENYKLSCAVIEQPITAANPYILDPKTYVDDDMVLRSYACPSCGLLLTTEMVRPTDPPLWDIQLNG